MELLKRSVIPLVVMLFISMFMAFPIFPAAATTPLPVLEARPAVIEVPEEGDDVAIEIWATNVAEDWEIIGFEFSVPFQTEWLAPAYPEAGTFMEAFVNGGELMVFYSVPSDIPYEPNWNLTTVLVLILPDLMGTYHAPFPSEEGRLITLHYTALEPGVGMSMDIDIIGTLIIDQNLNQIAEIDLDPNTLNLMSQGRWITAYIETTNGYDVNDIDVSSIMLNDTVPVANPEAPKTIGDYDEDGVPDLMVKFDRSAVSEFILSKDIKFGDVTLTLTGHDDEGAVFQGSDTIRVRMPGDVNIDGKSDMRDIGTVARAFGTKPKNSRWNEVADENEDRKINILDIAITASYFGTTY